MKKHQIKLIDSTYPAKDTKDILFSLIDNKIQFLNQQIISQHERYGESSKHLETRVTELRKELRELLETLKPVDGNQNQVEISCTIELTIKEPEKVLD